MANNETKFRKEFKTISRVWSKKEFQEMRGSVIKQGFIFTKTDSGYTMHAQNGVLLLKAMNGTRGYLVRTVADLFEPQPVKAADLFN